MIHKEALEIAANIIRHLGSDIIANKLDIVSNDPTINNLMSLVDETDLFLNFLEEKKKRMFSFGGKDQIMIMRCFIVGVRKEWTSDGHAELIVNEMSEDVSLKDNPYKNLHIIYDDDEVRDRDFERLQMILK